MSQEDKNLSTSKKNWFSRLRERIARSSSRLRGGISQLFASGSISTDQLVELEDILLEADFGLEVTDEIIDDLKKVKDKSVITFEQVLELVTEVVHKRLSSVIADLPPVHKIKEASAIKSDNSEHEKKPYVILFSGVNGAGKTTTIGKIASQYHKAGLKVLLVAGDTFRAAAAEQLAVWAQRAGCDFIQAKSGSEPSGLVWDAITRAQGEGHDLVIIDTAGRLHNRIELMDQLARIKRSIEKANNHPLDEHFLVVDSATGQAALSQVEEFSKVAKLSGLIVTKLDNTPKAGIVVAIAAKNPVPLLAIGIGEGIDDLKTPDPMEFSQALLSDSLSG